MTSNDRGRYKEFQYTGAATLLQFFFYKALYNFKKVENSPTQDKPLMQRGTCMRQLKCTSLSLCSGFRMHKPKLVHFNYLKQVPRCISGLSWVGLKTFKVLLKKTSMLSWAKLSKLGLSFIVTSICLSASSLNWSVYNYLNWFRPV